MFTYFLNSTYSCLIQPRSLIAHTLIIMLDSFIYLLRQLEAQQLEEEKAAAEAAAAEEAAAEAAAVRTCLQ